MERSYERKVVPQEHIANIFKEYTSPSRVLRSFTNLSNTVIQTALNGQSKFIFEILQNADDAFEDHTKVIEVEFILQSGYLIVHHNGKGFDYNDVERICDYASQIEEVKANDLSKTGYKGLGFKSLFNLSDCIYVYSNGYSFRFDKSFWRDPQSRPWQIIPIWCRYEDLPLNGQYAHNKPVNFILRLDNVDLLKCQLMEVVNQPDLLLFLNRVNKLIAIVNQEKYLIERKIDSFEQFSKVVFYINQQVVSTWLLRIFKQHVPKQVQQLIREASQYIYPEKIKSAQKVPFTFALKVNDVTTEVSTVQGVCYGTLPTQLHLNLPYHVNTFFILNLDRTQLHENEWNSFLISKLGSLQLKFLRDLAMIPNLRNYVIELLVRKVAHPYEAFCKAFLNSFKDAVKDIAWLPAHKGHFLKLGEAWSDQIEFFKQNFPHIRDHIIYPHLISYDVRSQMYLDNSEAKRFTFEKLLTSFPDKYYDQLTEQGYIDFINYLYEKLKNIPHTLVGVLKHTHFLIAKDKTLIPPKGAWIENNDNPFPDFLNLNPINDKFLPPDKIFPIKEWLICLEAKQFNSAADIIKESLLANDSNLEINRENHIEIMSFLAKNYDLLTHKDMERLKKKLVVLTESNEFRSANLCYLSEAVPIKELKCILSNNEQISSTYEESMVFLKEFFIRVGVNEKLEPIQVLRRSVLNWIIKDEIKHMLTENYAAVIEYIADNYYFIASKLKKSEKKELRQIPVITCDHKLQRAENCYFDTAVPKIAGLEGAVSRNKLVSTKNISENVYNFFLEIGVADRIQPKEVLQRTVFSWIKGDDIQRNITYDNHKDILKYIARYYLASPDTSFTYDEMNALSRITVLTKGDKFREACKCYWSLTDDHHSEEIPEIESIISSDSFVSPDYSSEIKNLLLDLGVRYLSFTAVYEKYCNHLDNINNLRWFFSKLTRYYSQHHGKENDKLLNFIQRKFQASRCLLGKNDKMYLSSELYSSQFESIYYIDPNSLPLLNYEKLPDDFEKWLGVKRELDLNCIQRLLEALRSKPLRGEKETLTFFSTLLEQLKSKDTNEVKNCKLSLLSKRNELKPAKDLYYFIDENDDCIYEECYLKRIHGMSHDDTLMLAKLCGVNTIPFEQTVKFGNETPIYDNSLKEFYLERLPFIVLQESKKLNDSCSVILNRLYDEICSIELSQCRIIFVHYPFGNCSTRSHFDSLKLYVTRKWLKEKSKVHNHLKKTLEIKSNIDSILYDMDSLNKEDTEDWLNEKNEDFEKFYSIQKELQQLQTEIVDTSAQDEEMYSSADENYWERDALAKFERGFSLESSSEEDSDDMIVEDKSSTTDESESVAGSEDEDVIDINTKRPVVDINTKWPVVGEPDIEYDVSKYLFDYQQELLNTPSSRELQWPILAEAVSHPSTDAVLVRKDSDDMVVEDKSSPTTQCAVKIKKDDKYIELSDESESVAGSENEDVVEINTKWPVVGEPDIKYDVSKYLFNYELELLNTPSSKELQWPTLAEAFSHPTTDAVLVCKDSDDMVVEDISSPTTQCAVKIKKGEEYIQLSNESESVAGSQDIVEIYSKWPVVCVPVIEYDVSNYLLVYGLELFNTPSLKELQWPTLAEAVSHPSTDAVLFRKNSDDMVIEDKSSTTQCAVKIKKDEEYIELSNESESVAGSEDVVEINTKWPVVCEPDIAYDVRKYLLDYELELLYTPSSKELQWPTLTEAVSHPSTDAVLVCKGSSSLLEDSNEKRLLKRLGEKYAFEFLQEHYRRKYPNSKYSSSDGKFTLLGNSSPNVEIVWVNETQERGYPYDLMLRKDGEVKRVIEVKPTNVTDGDSFDINHSEYIKKVNRLTLLFPQYKEKYCLYRVFNVENPLATTCEKSFPSALYKVMLLKNA